MPGWNSKPTGGELFAGGGATGAGGGAGVSGLSAPSGKPAREGESRAFGPLSGGGVLSSVTGTRGRRFSRGRTSGAEAVETFGSRSAPAPASALAMPGCAAVTIRTNVEKAEIPPFPDELFEAV